MNKSFNYNFRNHPPYYVVRDRICNLTYYKDKILKNCQEFIKNSPAPQRLEIYDMVAKKVIK